MSLEAQALANSIWDHGAHGVTQVNKSEVNEKHLLQFCPYLQWEHEISQEHSDNPMFVPSAPRAGGERQQQQLQPTLGHPNPQVIPQLWHEEL